MASYMVKAYSFRPLRDSPKAEITWILLLSLLLLLLSSCASRGSPNSTSPPAQPEPRRPVEKEVSCDVPYQAEPNRLQLMSHSSLPTIRLTRRGS